MANVRDSVASGMTARTVRKQQGRKATGRGQKGRQKPKGGLTTRSAKGKSRRIIFKKNPMRAMASAPTPVTSNKIYYKVLRLSDHQSFLSC